MAPFQGKPLRSKYQEEQDRAREKAKRQQLEGEEAVRQLVEDIEAQNKQEELQQAANPRPPSNRARGYNDRTGGNLLNPPPKRKLKVELDDSDDDLDEQRVVKRTAVAPPMLLVKAVPLEFSSADVVNLIEHPNEKNLDPKLTVEHVEFRKTTRNGNNDWRRMRKVALITFSQGTNVIDIDRAVIALNYSTDKKPRYFGCGFDVAVQRVDPDNAESEVQTALREFGKDVLPFGAVKIPVNTKSHAPTRGNIQGRNSRQSSSRPESAQVIVHTPKSLMQRRIIHRQVCKMIELGPDDACRMEADMMADPRFHRDPLFRFLWDPFDRDGVYYRWLLYERLTRHHRGTGTGTVPAPYSLHKVRDDVSYLWRAPVISQLEEDVFEAGQIHGHPGYQTDQEWPMRFAPKFPDMPPDGLGDNPLDREYLGMVRSYVFTVMLAKIPTSNATLALDDVGAITTFALCHSGATEQVKDRLIMNLRNPFAYNMRLGHGMNTEANQAPNGYGVVDQSGAHLVALHLVTDICINGSDHREGTEMREGKMFGKTQRETSTHWALIRKIQEDLVELPIFEELAQLVRTNRWGLMRWNRWKVSIGWFFSKWEGGSYFSGDAVQQMRKKFLAEMEAVKPAN